MKKLIVLISLITIASLWGTPLNRQVQNLRKNLAEHSKSEEESWNRLRTLDQRVSKLERHFASPNRYSDEDEDDEDEDE